METVSKPHVPAALRALRDHFASKGHEMWLVGGCVRDLQRGIDPKDTDLATDATPDEQLALYAEAGVTSIPTGLHHGTITAMLDGEGYEITSLRTETDHDGRWAKTAYTRDIVEDLSRRDLTINAMALTFDGDLIDPFGGRDDLANGRVRFVGDAGERMREDYLRILRFLRFHGRFSDPSDGFDAAAEKAIIANAAGLKVISRERVWNEMGKIIVGPLADRMLATCHDLGLAPFINLPVGRNSVDDVRASSDDPVALFAHHLGDPALVTQMAAQWKWSSRDRAKGRLIAERLASDLSLSTLKVRAAVNGEPLEWLADAAALSGASDVARTLRTWTIPDFPINGDDILAAGAQPGREVGRILHVLRSEWGDSGFRINRTNLLKKVARELV